MNKTNLKLAIVAAVLACQTSSALAQQPQDVMRELDSLKKANSEAEAKLKMLEKKMEQLQVEKTASQPSQRKETTPPQTALDQALEKAVSSDKKEIKRPGQFAAKPVAPGSGRLIDISFLPQLAAGTSSAKDEQIETLQGGGHDPKRRGFTLQQGELSLGGNVDPYFYAEGHIIFLEDEVETEEAFITSTALPAGLELEAGLFLTEFGLINPSHPHAWDYIDQPIINTRMFGGDGQRSVGARLSKLLPLPWSSELHLGMQQNSGEFMPSFRGGEIGHSHGEEEEGHSHEEDEMVEEESASEEGEELAESTEDEEHLHEEELDLGGIGQRPVQSFETEGLEDFVYLVRLDNFFDVSEEVGVKLGASGLFGKNSSGEDSDTVVYGADLLVKWTPRNNFRGYPYVKWQSEVIARDYDAGAVVLEDGDILAGEETLNDYGFYSQLVYGFTYGWSAGARVEWAGGSGESVEGRDSDPFRSDRLRLSPLLAYRPTEFSRVRLQYNYDDADSLDSNDEHSVWVGFDVLIGTHPAHRYGQS